MHDDIEKDIYREINYTPLTLFGEKLNIGIIGGGKAALIKIQSFYKKKSYIEVLALDFLDDFNKFDKSRVKLIKGEYNKEFIKDKHLIIIAVDDNNIIKKVKEDCEKSFKIYIDSSSFREGMGVIPVSRESENITISVNTKLGNPRGSVMIADNIYKDIKKIDKFIKLTSDIINNLKIDKEVKNQILKFINTDDCNYFYQCGKFIDVLRLFYNDEIVEKITLLGKEEKNKWN